MSTSDRRHPQQLWEFIDEQGTFSARPAGTGRLYFPLANEAGLLSSISPDLRGDIKTGLNTFFSAPVTAENLHDTKQSRNFWVHIEDYGAWSATGVSARQEAKRWPAHSDPETVTVEAGFLWHKVVRRSSEAGLEAEIVNFAPATADAVELMSVTLTNTGKSRLRLTSTSAIPIFGRSADNLRDHHHVTSLLHRVAPHPHGVIVKPTMSFDERGHKTNEISYGVLGYESGGEAPVGSFPTVDSFIGEGGSLEAPRAVIEQLPPPEKLSPFHQGRSTIGALRFRTVTLGPGEKVRYILVLGVLTKDVSVDELGRKYGSAHKFDLALRANRSFWAQRLDKVRFTTADPNYDRWMRWVSLQPTLRKLFGCSFLPDFDYGRGGRGWRDLWQDCLALLLSFPEEARPLLVNNFNGIRIDGSNATIIGSKPGEFIADRNNITRVWMDHGVWPYLTLELYIHQTGDFGILFEQGSYFRDRQQSRARSKDTSWTEAYGKELKDRKGRPVRTTVFERCLVQHLVQYYNVGEHNHIRLENADWNDGLDMAYARGESVTFSCLYASNLRRMADLIEEAAMRAETKTVELSSEVLGLLDGLKPGKRFDHGSAEARRKRLEAYFESVQPEVSGRKSAVPVRLLAADLRAKADAITEHVRKKEWVSTRAGEGFYNGYYDDHGHKVEGETSDGVQMTLTGQTFPIMSGVATTAQVTEIFKSVRKHLKDREHGGFRLNTDFGRERHDLGRAFSFAYGEKENGAFFSHMAVMFSNALYQRGFVPEGREVLDAIYRMCLRTDNSKIFPGIPEYFNSEGRGLYHYLTGSASWLVLTVLTQVFGFRGRNGDLLLAPKLTLEDFGRGSEVSVEAYFAGKRLKVIYRNAKRLSYEHYCVSRVDINGREITGLDLHKKEVLILRETLLRSCKKNENTVLVELE
ncbi:MAG: hypothetical protein MOGMAGMI_01484 [Candidatus Omnitrophica bacterium]|nr:hypothetical protein [Candidatus Omnitrophota bacterium]